MKHKIKKTFNRVHVAVILTSLIIAGFAFWLYYEYLSLPNYAVPIIPEIHLAQENDTVLVFAPHSDDEVIGAGGYIYQSLQNGARVFVVMMTNGDGHLFSTLEEFKKIYPSANNYIESGYTRQNETKAALSKLGLPEKNIFFLGYPDQGLDNLLHEYWTTPYKSKHTKSAQSPYNNSYQSGVSYTGQSVDQNIKEIIRNFKPDIIITSSKNDLHPDHSATYSFVKNAINETNSKALVFTYLVHYPRFPRPNGLRTSLFLAPPMKLFNFLDGWTKLSLDENAEDSKAEALSEYHSQLKVPFLKKLLLSFIRKNELFQKDF